MPIGLAVNGTTYPYPVQGDQNWGQGATQWAQAVTNAIGAPLTTGTWAAPVSVVAANGVVFNSVNFNNIGFINGSGGPVVVTATNPVQLPSAAGQQLILMCTDSTNTVTRNSGSGLSLSGDACVCSQGSV